MCGFLLLGLCSMQVSALSGGERNRVHIAKQLKQGYNVLLLDEPTNDLDVATLRSLEDALAHFAGAVVIVSHDRWFLNRVATDIIAFEKPGVRCVPIDTIVMYVLFCPTPNHSFAGASTLSSGSSVRVSRQLRGVRAGRQEARQHFRRRAHVEPQKLVRRTSSWRQHAHSLLYISATDKNECANGTTLRLP